MTYEDVKKIRENPTSEDVDNEELHTLIDAAIDKQIKRSPTIIPQALKIGFCANCNTAVLKGQKYCFECGQALKWGGENGTE